MTYEGDKDTQPLAPVCCRLPGLCFMLGSILSDGGPLIFRDEFQCLLNLSSSMEDIKQGFNPVFALAGEYGIPKSCEKLLCFTGFIQLLTDPLDRSHKMYL